MFNEAFKEFGWEYDLVQETHGHENHSGYFHRLDHYGDEAWEHVVEIPYLVKRHIVTVAGLRQFLKNLDNGMAVV